MAEEKKMIKTRIMYVFKEISYFALSAALLLLIYVGACIPLAARGYSVAALLFSVGAICLCIYAIRKITSPGVKTALAFIAFFALFNGLFTGML